MNSSIKVHSVNRDPQVAEQPDPLAGQQGSQVSANSTPSVADGWKSLVSGSSHKALSGSAETELEEIVQTLDNESPTQNSHFDPIDALLSSKMPGLHERTAGPQVSDMPPIPRTLDYVQSKAGFDEVGPFLERLQALEKLYQIQFRSARDSLTKQLTSPERHYQLQAAELAQRGLAEVREQIALAESYFSWEKHRKEIARNEE